MDHENEGLDMGELGPVGNTPPGAEGGVALGRQLLGGDGRYRHRYHHPLQQAELHRDAPRWTLYGYYEWQTGHNYFSRILNFFKHMLYKEMFQVRCSVLVELKFC